ncbi:hypothetical protein B0H16DRAFT_1471739 [Mycena metata]|uniref:Uncharacterized protein n=1 Tax=Mycena metata TaxID=1033252 RepID=A0AAD7HQ14_9AGAR|nr:hypothetical protein B0H16DRAFT_1471739 [Mycena metata]
MACIWQASSILLPGVVVGESESEKVRELPSVWFETNRLRVAARKHCSAFLSRAAYPSLLLWSILTGLWGKRIPNFDQTSPRFNWPTDGEEVIIQSIATRWRRSPLAALANQYRRDRRPAPLGYYCAFGASHNPRIDCPRFTGINRHEGQSSANNVYMREKFTGKSFLIARHYCRTSVKKRGAPGFHTFESNPRRRGLLVFVLVRVSSRGFQSTAPHFFPNEGTTRATVSAFRVTDHRPVSWVLRCPPLAHP